MIGKILDSVFDKPIEYEEEDKPKGVEHKPKFEGFIIAKKNEGNPKRFREQLLAESSIITVVGGRRQGKSAMSFRIMEDIYSATSRNCYVLGWPHNKLHILPSWIEPIEELEHAKDGGVVLVDETAIVANARRSQSGGNVKATKLMAIAGHRDLTLIWITQNSALSDINSIRLADVVLIKNPSLMQRDLERKELKNMYDECTEFFKLKNETKGETEVKKYCYVKSQHFIGFIKTTLPSFWNEDISKSYSESNAQHNIKMNILETEEEMEEYQNGE